jgi:hypothetical protein
LEVKAREKRGGGRNVDEEVWGRYVWKEIERKEWYNKPWFPNPLPLTMVNIMS